MHALADLFASLKYPTEAPITKIMATTASCSPGLGVRPPAVGHPGVVKPPLASQVIARLELLPPALNIPLH